MWKARITSSEITRVVKWDLSCDELNMLLYKMIELIDDDSTLEILITKEAA